MHQVVTNLLHNAIKFTLPDGEVRITAAVNSMENPNEVIIEIHDTGIGIPRKDLPRIFERFYKSDRARTRSLGGTGLGLAIARHIVEAHGGRIWAKSKEGKGSSFYFSLPAVDDEK
jgi:signal transduction histidine kinase